MMVFNGGFMIVCYCQAHLLSCTLDAIPCHLHCQQRVSRLAHEDHVRNFCPNRRQSCEFCHIDFSGVQYDVSGSAKLSTF